MSLPSQVQSMLEDWFYEYYDELRTENPKAVSSRRTSLIVDPPKGRIPPLIPDAQRRSEERRAARGTDSYQERPHQERCLVWTHEGPPMLPPPYNDLYQIFQAPGVVVIFPEMANNPPRIVATDGRPPISDRIRQWPGASRGHWDGDTLVVETSNFSNKTSVKCPSDATHGELLRAPFKRGLVLIPLRFA